MADLDDYPVCVERSIRWGEMDAYRHVNNVHYFRYFEDARIAYFREMGIHGTDHDETDTPVGPILAATSCKFLQPLAYPDDILVGARTSELGDDRFEIEYGITSSETEGAVAAGDSIVVSYDYDDETTVQIPDAWRAAIRELED